MPDFDPDTPENTQPPPDFNQIRQHLADSLNNTPADHEADMLHRQLEALDALFHFTLSKGVGTQHFHSSAQPHYHDARMLALSLRVQQQCVATLRTTRAMDYMQALQDYNAQKQIAVAARPDKLKGACPHDEIEGDTPRPLKNDERTIDEA